MGSIMSYLGLAKYAIPVFDAIIAELKVAIPAEKVDVIAAYEAFVKAWADAKTAFEALVTAVKSAIASA